MALPLFTLTGYIKPQVERDLGLELDVTEIQRIADRVYGEELPSRIGDAMSQRTLEFNTVAGTADYDVKAQADSQGFLLWGVREPLVLLNNDPIWYVTDPEQFWLVHQHGSTSQQQPASALLDAFTLTLFPIPSSIWPVKLWVSGGRGVYPSAGIASQVEADAIASAVTFYYGSSIGMEEAAAAALERYNAFMKPLHRAYGGSVRSQPMQAREF